MRSSLALLGLAATLVGPLASSAELLERVLAVVNGTPVLLSEVRVVQRLKGRDPEAALEAAIDEQLMYQEAVRLGQARLTQEEEQAAYESLSAQAAAAGIDEPALRRVARRQASIIKYIDVRFRPQVRAAERQAPELPQPANEGEALERRVEQWIEELRSAAHIRRLPPEPGSP